MSAPDADTAHFYDGLAPFYHLIYPDWDAAISRQGNALAALLQELGVERGGTVLDVACGIGTQSLGLLNNGYNVTASDISSAAVDRFRREAEARSLTAVGYVDDMRTLAHAKPGAAALIACDNSVPHLLSDREIAEAFRNFYRCVQPGGCAIISVRDYAAIERRNPDVRPYGLRYDGERRFLAVQVWEWDDDHYDVGMYLTTEDPRGVCQTRVLRSRYYAVSIRRLMELLAEAGFRSVERRDDVIFQPVLIGRRPGTSQLPA